MRKTTRSSSKSVSRKRPHRLRWVIDPLAEEPGYIERSMFGCLAAYLNGRLVIVLADQGEPWQGVLIPTDKERHAAVIAEFPSAHPHPILGKWLYLPEGADDFDSSAEAVVDAIMSGDARFGVVPEEKKRGKKKVKRS